MAIVFNSTKWNRCVLSGLSVAVFDSTDSPLLFFGTVINSPGWLEMHPKRPCVGCLKLMK